MIIAEIRDDLRRARNRLDMAEAAVARNAAGSGILRKLRAEVRSLEHRLKLEALACYFCERSGEFLRTPFRFRGTPLPEVACECCKNLISSVI